MACLTFAQLGLYGTATVWLSAMDCSYKHCTVKTSSVLNPVEESQKRVEEEVRRRKEEEGEGDSEKEGGRKEEPTDHRTERKSSSLVKVEKV